MIKPKKPRILCFDIETSPLISYTWGLYEQNVVGVKEDWYMMSFAYKWLGEKTVKVKALPDYQSYKKDSSCDKELVKDLWELFDEADAVMAHNGNAFDIKKANARFILHGLKPPAPYKSIDTLKIARKHFKFNSNKLDALGEYLGVGRKIQTGGFKLWLDCMDGCEKSWSRMKAYNRQDVQLLEDVYYKLLPYIDNHPNLNLYKDTLTDCPNCGSEKIHKRGFTYTRVNKYQRWQCQECSSWHQSGIKINSIVR